MASWSEATNAGNFAARPTRAPSRLATGAREFKRGRCFVAVWSEAMREFCAEADLRAEAQASGAEKSKGDDAL
jgi:hypothetical protein